MMIFYLPHSYTSHFMLPQIVYRILPPGTDRPAFRQVERHLLRRIETVQHHEYDTVARVARPILSRVCGIRDVVVIYAPPERRKALTHNGILVDLDDVLVSQDLKGLFRSISKVSTDEQGRLQKRPGSEMALRFIEGQIPWRCALVGIANFQQIQIIVAKEVGSLGVKRCCVDDGGKCSPRWPDIARVTPRLSDSPAPDEGLVPSPLGEGVLEGDVCARGKLGDGVGHACEAPDHAVLGDVVGRDVWVGCQIMI